MGKAALVPDGGAVVGAGTAVAGADVATGTTVAVAEDPQANSKATNKRTIALGRCLLIRGLDHDLGI